MLRFRPNSESNCRKALIAVFALLSLLAPVSAFAAKKKQPKQEAAKPAAEPKSQSRHQQARMAQSAEYLRACDTPDTSPVRRSTTLPAAEQPKQKSSWMDRLAGVQDPEQQGTFQGAPVSTTWPLRNGC